MNTIAINLDTSDDINPVDLEMAKYNLAMLTGCQDAHIAAALAALNQIGELIRKVDQARREEIAALSRPRCSGHEFTNSKGSLYMHHNGGGDCPTCDNPRKYIGRKQARQMAARQAAINYRNWRQKVDALNAARHELQQIEGRLNMVATKQKRLL